MNLSVLPVAMVQAACSACGHELRGTVLGCQRCSSLMHDGCYLTRVAGAAEAARLTEVDVAILCRGCRS